MFVSESEFFSHLVGDHESVRGMSYHDGSGERFYIAVYVSTRSTHIYHGLEWISFPVSEGAAAAVYTERIVSILNGEFGVLAFLAEKARYMEAGHDQARLGSDGKSHERSLREAEGSGGGDQGSEEVASSK